MNAYSIVGSIGASRLPKGRSSAQVRTPAAGAKISARHGAVALAAALVLAIVILAPEVALIGLTAAAGLTGVLIVTALWVQNNVE